MFALSPKALGDKSVMTFLRPCMFLIDVLTAEIRINDLHTELLSGDKRTPLQFHY